MRSKILKAVSAVLLSGMILGTVITPMSAAAAASSVEHEHTNWTFSEIDHSYTQADSWGHRKESYGRFYCSDCKKEWWGTLTVDEPHTVSGGKCVQCGYEIH